MRGARKGGVELPWPGALRIGLPTSAQLSRTPAGAGRAVAVASCQPDQGRVCVALSCDADRVMLHRSIAAVRWSTMPVGKEARARTARACPYCRAPGTHSKAQSTRGPVASWACGTVSFGEHTIKSEICVLRTTIAALRSVSERVRTIADEQAADPGLWIKAQTTMEAQLQMELRRMHAVIKK